MGGLADRIRYVLAHPLSGDHAIDPMRELANVLREVGLEPGSGGGAVTFVGCDPIVSSTLPFATMAAVALMAKAVSVAALWRFRGGQGQDLSVNLGKALHRLCPFYDKKWELLNGYAPGNPADPKNPFMPTNMYRTRDNRRILFMNIYPGSRSAARAFLGCNDDPTAIGNVIRKLDAFDLEEQANRAGLQATVVRSAHEFLDTEQCRFLEDLPLVDIEKIADSDPEPFTPRPKTPLDGVRALGFSHVIAGPGLGRALAYHGADVLNLWTPNDFEMDFNYYSANLGMRSAIMGFGRPDEMARFRRLGAGADIFFANRRPGLLEGSRVIGTAGGKEKCDWLVNEAHFDAAIDYKSEDIGARLSELCPNGIDVFFDNVGGEVLNEVLARINLHARIVLCGSISKSDAAKPQPGPANYSNLVARRARMEGITGLDYPARVPEAFEALGRWHGDGSLVHKQDVAYGLENAPKALLRLFSGENFGKQLVKVADAAA